MTKKSRRVNPLHLIHILVSFLYIWYQEPLPYASQLEVRILTASFTVASYFERSHSSSWINMSRKWRNTCRHLFLNHHFLVELGTRLLSFVLSLFDDTSFPRMDYYFFGFNKSLIHHILQANSEKLSFHMNRCLKNQLKNRPACRHRLQLNFWGTFLNVKWGIYLDLL